MAKIPSLTMLRTENKLTKKSHTSASIPKTLIIYYLYINVLKSCDVIGSNPSHLSPKMLILLVLFLFLLFYSPHVHQPFSSSLCLSACQSPYTVSTSSFPGLGVVETELSGDSTRRTLSNNSRNPTGTWIFVVLHWGTLDKQTQLCVVSCAPPFGTLTRVCLCIFLSVSD